MQEPRDQRWMWFLGAVGCLALLAVLFFIGFAVFAAAVANGLAVNV